MKHLLLWSLLGVHLLFAQEMTMERWLEELNKARDPDLKADYDLLDKGYKDLKTQLVPHLEKLLKTTPHARVIAKSLNYIKDLGTDGYLVIPLLKICLNDVSDSTRQKALQVLRSVYNEGPNKEKYKDLFPELANILLNDWRSDLRNICAQTIERLNAPEFVYACILGLEDYSKSARGQMFKTLKKIAKPDQLLFINQVKEWKDWFEANKDKYPSQIVPPGAKMPPENSGDVSLDLSTYEGTLAGFSACAEKAEFSKMGELWSKKDAKHGQGSASEEEQKETEQNRLFYYGRMLPYYQQFAKRLIQEKPKNESDDDEKKVLILEQKKPQDRVRKVVLLKEYKSIEIFVKSGSSPKEIEEAKGKCQEMLDEVQLLATTPEDVEKYFEEKAKELAESGRDQKRHLVKYFIMKEFDPNIQAWFKKATPNEISPIFARERGASCFLYLETAWHIDSFDPHFTE